MNFYARRFNLYLLLAAAVLLGGCATHKKEDKKIAVLRIHIESSANVGASGKTISVLRAQPVLVTVTAEPILTEANIIMARVFESRGGYALEIKFDEAGAWILEQYTSANPGKHFAIFAQWDEKFMAGRWLAAPVISRRSATGMIAFTPDASREEMDELVFGLNNVATQRRKSTLKF